MQGKIIKGVAGSYEVATGREDVLTCSARGLFRRDGIRPLPGDDVEAKVLDAVQKTGVITAVLPRHNALVRPAVANVDQALVIFAVSKPKPHFNLLDRFLLMMETEHVDTVICFNKTDLASEDAIAQCRQIYAKTGYRTVFTSTLTMHGMEELRTCLKGKMTTVAGPSGVGKSSIINLLQDHAHMETGAISEKIERGKHTTRHSQLIRIDADSFIMDTPGFSSLALPQLEAEEVQQFFPEFARYEPFCRFQGCMHLKEPQCGVREALAEGKISPVRYENYRLIVEEVRERKKY